MITAHAGRFSDLIRENDMVLLRNSFRRFSQGVIRLG